MRCDLDQGFYTRKNGQLDLASQSAFASLVPAFHDLHVGYPHS